MLSDSQKNEVTRELEKVLRSRFSSGSNRSSAFLKQGFHYVLLPTYAHPRKVHLDRSLFHRGLTPAIAFDDRCLRR